MPLPYVQHISQRPWTSVLAILVLLYAVAAAAEDSVLAEDDVFEMSLAELLQVEVTSVSKKSQTLSEAAAAVFVITQDDIRRSGITSIPEALRMAPGIQVARINSSSWAVSTRGFNGLFANKLLVLIDGRSIYTPLFSGVFWDVQDVVLEDVERIEVIRGPGASLWGANAVNGIINIITKRSQDTQGTLVSAGLGTEERGFTSVRHGGAIGEEAYYRVYAKYFDRDGAVLADTGKDGADGWDQWRTGFRVDAETGLRDSWNLQGDAYTGDSGTTAEGASLTPPFLSSFDSAEQVQGGNLLLRWQRSLSDVSELGLQVYYDRAKRDRILYEIERDTFDLDFQHRFPLGRGHDILWGLGYRHTQDAIDNGFVFSLDPDERDTDLYSAFIQDEISLQPNRLRLTLGSKFEHNDYTGFEIQPSIRLLWLPDEQQSLWAAISRAVRTPSRTEHDMRTNRLIPPGTPENMFPIPFIIGVLGDEGFDSEELTAYELGYRIQPSQHFSLDIAAFYNDYDELLDFMAGQLVCEPSGTAITALPPCFLSESNVLLPLQLSNGLEAQTYGVEVSADWRGRDWWRLQLAYSYLQVDLDGGSTATADATTAVVRDPHQQLSLRPSLDLRHDVDFDLWLRYVDSIPDLDVERYVTMDARLAWRPRESLELSIVGQNLLDNQHQEFAADFNTLIPAEIERSVYGKAEWSF